MSESADGGRWEWAVQYDGCEPQVIEESSSESSDV